MLLFALFLALVWGGIWAAFLQLHPLGQFLVIKRTWITVVIGVGADLLIALLVVDWMQWALMVAIIGMSSVGIIYRSLTNELKQEVGLLDEIKEIFSRKQAAGK
jgi:Kef-type K+ transport system membrane component KefB